MTFGIVGMEDILRKLIGVSLRNISYQKSCLALLAAALALTAAACATTNSRINEHKEEFSTMKPEDQMKVQNGDIDQGFTEDMVYMAKGNPSEKQTVQRGGKSVSIWKYGVSRPVPVENGVPNASDTLDNGFGYPEFSSGGAHHPSPYQNAPPLEVEFENGKVARWY